MNATSSVRQPARRSSRLAAKLLVLSLALLIAAALGEVAVRIAKPGFPGFRLPQVAHQPIAGLGFQMVPSQVGYSFASRVTINSAGYRGPEFKTPSGSPLILAIGDSMTYGVGVEDHETYAQQLQRSIAREWPASDPEVLNMGVQRYFPFQEIDALKLQLSQRKPDIVTMSIYANDLSVRPEGDYVREFENEREQAATAFHNIAPPLYLGIKNLASVELLKNVYLATNRRENIADNALNGRILPKDERRWKGLETELAALDELARLHQFTPLIIFVPMRQQITGDLPASVYPRRLVEYTRQIGVASIDLLEAFRQSLRAGTDPYLPWDNHMSVAGHRIVADAILQEVRRQIPDALRENTRQAAASN